MSLQIKDPEAEALAIDLAKRSGQPVDRVVLAALKAHAIPKTRRPRVDFYEALAVARSCSTLPDLDLTSQDEILGYDEAGLWS